MKKVIVSLLLFFFAALAATAQPPASKEQQELERERQQLKRELEQAQELLGKNKESTKENLTLLGTLNHKLNIQERVVNNISKEINLMDNNIYKSQKDINKLQFLLDTLKQEYSKSMVYAYKNRSNSDFLNFIFSAANFNDAIKRITYLKSYRNYREMQGDNILRTQVLLKTRIAELSGSKQKKNVVLQSQSKEAEELQKQQEEKNRIVAKLKAQGKELSNQIAAKKKQMLKVNNAFAAAIKRANEEARKAAAIAAANAKKNNTAAAAANPPSTTTTKSTKAGRKTSPTKEPAVKSVFASPEDVSLGAKFESNRNKLPWPVSSGYLLLHFGLNKLENGVEVNSQGISIATEIGSPVKAIFEGEVQLVNNYDDVEMVVIKHGKYFTGYSNIKDVNLTKGQMVHIGQVIGKAAANLDGIGAVDLLISNEQTELNPESWLKPR